MELQVKNVSFGYTGEPLFTEVTFSIYQSQKVGLVGANGAGKSTLLKMIRGILLPESGIIDFKGSLAYIPQEVRYDEELESSCSVIEYINPDLKAENHEIKKLCKRFGIAEIDLTVPPKGFSGGVKTKLAIIRALISEPDLLLLDEPTNFMDQEGKRWVMQLLAQYPKSLLLISHDLALMDKAIDRVLFVNPHKHTIEVYTGNYSSFRRQQREAEELLKRKVLIEQKKIKKLEQSLVKVSRYSSAKGVRVKTRMRHRLEEAKANLPSLPQDIRSIKVQLPEPSRVGEIPILARGITKVYGDYTVFRNLDFTIRRGDRVALLGPNGAGKTTLIKVLLGIAKADSGTVKSADNLFVGYYSQEMENLHMDKTVIQEFCETVERMESYARPFLGKFLINSNKIMQKVSSLSGGEKTRLAIALLCARPYNMLVLDEPTTYLDVMSQRVILEALKEYRGTLIVVSHTEQFVTEIKPTSVYLMPEGRADFWDEKFLNRVGEI